ncbi:MAG: endonuclease/exonuclease/phosphatase family protein [Flavobacteriaceae bacterium]
METIRILTYNVRGCLGMDSVLSTARIAAAICDHKPDLIALQELDVGRARSAGVDQAREIAENLRMQQVFFHPALRVMEEEYGDAIITDRPARLIKAGPLPGLGWAPKLEPRGAVWASIDLGSAELQVINTHLGLGRAERRQQVGALLGEDWLGSDLCQGPAVLLGDFNSLPRGRIHNRIRRRMRDAYLAAHSRAGPRSTFPSAFPALRIDYVFVTEEIEVVRAEVVASGLTRLASDHLPLLVELRVPPAGGKVRATIREKVGRRLRAQARQAA